MAQILSILVVEDDPDDVILLTSILKKLPSKELIPQLFFAKTVEEATQALGQHLYDVIITDLYLPDSQGVDTFLEIQKKGGATPIIIVGASAEDEAANEAIKLGAQDYLPKLDLNVGLFARIIQHAIERHRLHESLKALSFTDELTGVYNRRGFFTLLEQQISLARRTKKGFYLFLIDFDYLKEINDTYGHLEGDRALIETAKCLRDSFRQHDIIGRIGGDEFAVVAINASVESGERLTSEMMNQLKNYNALFAAPYQLAFSVGKAYFDCAEELTLDKLMQQADSELYQDKRFNHKI